MFPHKLEINISVNLAILLGIAMILVDFVMVMSVQKILLRSEIQRGYLLISALETHLPSSSHASEHKPPNSLSDNADKLLRESGFSCAMVLDVYMNPAYFGGSDCVSEKDLREAAVEAIRSGEKNVKSFGTIWGVFWKQRQYLILSAPLYRNGHITGGSSVVLPLEGIYMVLRRTQQILFIYILINTVVLTLIGFYRLSKVTTKPLRSLLKRAEEYREDTDSFFLSEKENNEFSQLSRALNRMLKRISEDKKALHLTVQSLEKANKDLKQAQSDIIRAEKLASVGRLTSGIAHEIGNPISIVLGYLELLRQKDMPDDEKDEFISRAGDEISRISRIIRQLLDFSRPSDGMPETVSVHDLIEDIVNVMKFQPLMSDIRLRLSLFAEKDTILTDPDQLRQVFLNLMINAADAISSCEDTLDGELTITSEVAADPDLADHPQYLKIMFIDNGTGIPEQDLDNIFDPFYTTKEPGKGTGLGLSVSFMMIESIGGKIKGASEQGKGTTMTLYLPIQRSVDHYQLS